MDKISAQTKAGLVAQFECGNHAVERTVDAINQCEETLASLAARAASISASVTATLAKGGYLNELGEFGRTTVEADIAMARRQQLWQSLGWLIGAREADAVCAGKWVPLETTAK